MQIEDTNTHTKTESVSFIMPERMTSPQSPSQHRDIAPRTKRYAKLHFVMVAALMWPVIATPLVSDRIADLRHWHEYHPSVHLT